jgi:phasin
MPENNPPDPPPAKRIKKGIVQSAEARSARKTTSKKPPKKVLPSPQIEESSESVESAAGETPLSSESVELAGETPLSSERVELAAGETPFSSERVELAAGETPLSSENVELAASDTPFSSERVELAAGETFSSESVELVAGETPFTSSMEKTAADPKMTMQVPDAVRELVAKTIDQAEKAFGMFFDAAKKSVASIRSPGTEIPKHALSFAEQNMKSTFDHARKLVQATDLQQAMQIQSDFLKSQFTNAALQMQQITSEIMSCAIDASKDKFQRRPPTTIR